MITKIEPLEYIINKITHSEKKNKIELIYLSPQGKKVNQNDIKKLSTKKDIAIICGRNKGLDERIIKNFVDKELSIGDYIVNSGDIAVSIIINAINRFENNTKNLTALEQNTFKNNMFDYPCYTKPKIFKKLNIPKVLIHGNHKEINVWKKSYSKKKTWLYRPDLIKNKEKHGHNGK